MQHRSSGVPFGRLPSILAGSVIFSLQCFSAFGLEIDLIIGRPTAVGDKVITIIADGVRTPVTIPVTNLDEWDTPGERAANVATALVAANIVAAARAGNTVYVEAAGAKTLTAEFSGGTTGEEDRLAFLRPPQSDVQVASGIQFSGLLSGIDVNNQEAAYSAALSYGNVNVQTSVSFGSLGGGGLAALQQAILSNLFAALPSADRSNLSAGPTIGSILFQYPIGSMTFGVGIQSTDLTLIPTASLTMTQVPEPGTLTLLVLSVLVLVGGQHFGRQS